MDDAAIAYREALNNTVPGEESPIEGETFSVEELANTAAGVTWESYSNMHPDARLDNTERVHLRFSQVKVWMDNQKDELAKEQNLLEQSLEAAGKGYKRKAQQEETR